LIFAIADGALPSNVGGGYNLRMILRRINGTIDRMHFKLDIDELVDMHIDYLKDTYPELDAKREDVKTIISIESTRYENSKSRMQKIARRFVTREITHSKRIPTVNELITLYESDGITPEYLKEIKVISEIPSSFYEKLSNLHQSDKKKTTKQLPLENLPETDMLFYKDDPMEFDAKVLKVFEKSVVLDRTSFYARGGGQEPDHGTISGFKVMDVSKHGDVIVHELEGGIPKKGEVVSCKVDTTRRTNITKNHTSTHILNASSRKILGSWVWQHSAFKDNDHARLDITHHSSLTKEEEKQIEDAANDMVKQNIPVTIEYFDRGDAEQKYGFRIYQGGVVPVKSVRIVSIEDKDIEACGGTHVKKTGDIELIKIKRTKRIQDGVVRLEFVSGKGALDYVKLQELESKMKQSEIKIKEERERLRDEKKEKDKQKIPAIIDEATKEETFEKVRVGTNIGEDTYIYKCKSGLFYFNTNDQHGEFFHMTLGKGLTKKNPNRIYCGIFEENGMIRIIIYSGEKASKTINARVIAREVAIILGGFGGGDAKFAQGGGKDTSKKDEAIAKAKSMILG